MTEAQGTAPMLVPAGRSRLTLVDLGSLLVSILALLVSAYAAFQAEEAQVEQAEEQRRVQATDVLFQVKSTRDPYDYTRPARKGADAAETTEQSPAAVFLSNYHRLPVPATWLVGIKDETTRPAGQGGTIFTLGTLGSCQEMELDPYVKRIQSSGIVGLVVIFRDTAGQFWSRDTEGRIDSIVAPNFGADYVFAAGSGPTGSVVRLPIDGCAGG